MKSNNVRMDMKAHEIKYSEAEDNPCILVELNDNLDYEENLKLIYGMIDTYKRAECNLDMQIHIDWLKFKDADKLMQVAKENNFNISVVSRGGINYSLEQVVQLQAESKELIQIVKEANLTPLEQVVFLYNFVASRVYKESPNKMDSRELYRILSGDDIVCVGFANLFKYLCDNLDNENIKCAVAQADIVGIYRRAAHANNILYLKDEEYGADDYYVCDACFDCMHDDDEINSLPFLQYCLNTEMQFYKNMEPKSINLLSLNKGFKDAEKFFTDLGLSDEEKDFELLVSEREYKDYFTKTYAIYRQEFKSVSNEAINKAVLLNADEDKVIHLFTKREREKNKEKSLDERRKYLWKRMASSKEYSIEFMYDVLERAIEKVRSTGRDIDKYKMRKNIIRF